MGIIFLNGCTSAGKTSIARALQARAGRPWLHFGIDDGFRLLPARWHDHPDGFFFDRDRRGLVRLNYGDIGRRTLGAYRRAAVAMTNAGVDLIVDEVVLEAAFADDWADLLRSADVFAVAVHCALPELERREVARGDRCLGQARGQFDIVHQLLEYDFTVDTTSATPEDAAGTIEAAWLERGPPKGLRPR